MTDKELIRKVHNGDKEALNTIIEKYYDEIYRFCFYLIGNGTDAYDITQEVFLKFIRYVDSYRYKNLKGYLLTIARNLCYDFFRNKKDAVSIDEVVQPYRDDKQIDAAENRIILKDALMEIPAAQREVVVLRMYEGFKFMEIAKMLGCNISTVKSRYNLGVKRLRVLLRISR